MDEELAPANQGIDDMSFKDLAARTVAAMTPKPAITVAKQNEPNAAGKKAPAKSRTS